MKTIWMRVYLTCFSLICLSTSVLAQQKISLEEAIQIGLQNQYAIKIAKKREEIAKNDNTAGNAGFLPTIVGSAGKNYTVSALDQSFFGGLRPPLVQNGVKSDNGNLAANLVWTLYDGKGMFVLRNRLKEMQALGAKQTEGTIENLIAQISLSYYEIVRQNLRMNNFKKGLEISNDRLQLAKDRYEVGQGSKVDFYSAQVDYNEDKAVVLAQEQSVLNTKIAFNTLLVREHMMEVSVEPQIELLPKLQLDDIKKQALEQNPNIQASLINKKVSELDIKNAQSLSQPQIDLISGYTKTQVHNGAGFGVERGTSNIFSYGLRASINIFDGYNQKRRIQNAKINAEIAQDQLEDLKNNLIAAVERSYVSYQNALNLIQLETENYTIAKQNIDIAFDRFKVGIATSYELREVQRNAVAAETRLIEAKFAAKSAEIELLRLSGTLL